MRVADVGQQVEDLRLDRDVERRDRLVEDQHARLGRQRAGDRDPLALAARQRARQRARSGARRGRPARPARARAPRALPRPSRRGAAAAPRRSRRRRSGAGRGSSTGPGRRSAPRRRALRRSRAERGGRRAVAAAGARSCPPSARSSPTIILATVVLPEPDSPTIASEPPAATPRTTTSSTATSVAVLLAQARRLEDGVGSGMAGHRLARRSRISSRPQAAHDAVGDGRRSAARSRGTRPARSAQRGRERAARRRLERRHRPAGDRGEPLRRGVDARPRGDQRRACTGAAGRRAAARRGCVSTICPAYITAVRSQTALASSRSCVMNSSARPRSRRSSSRIAITSACVVTSSAVVGSSARSSRGSVSSAARDHHALQHAAGQLVRVLPQPPLAVLDADVVQHLDRAPARPRRCATPRTVRSASVMKSPIVRTGLMCARGSWKIIATSPRYCRSAPPRSAEHVAPVERDAARRRPRPAAAAAPIARAVIDLPEPDSPTSPTRLAGGDLERHVVQHRALLALDGQRHREALDLEQRRSPLRSRRGRRAARRAG